MDVYKTIAFSTEGKVYIGNLTEDNDIDSFKLTSLNPKEFKSDKIYVIIVDDRNEEKGSDVSVLSETKLVNETFTVTNISDLDINELIDVSNNLLKSFIRNRVLH